MNADGYIQFFGQRPIRLHLRIVRGHPDVWQTQFSHDAESPGKKLLAEETNIGQRKTRPHHSATDDALGVSGAPAGYVFERATGDSPDNVVAFQLRQRRL